VRYDTFGNRLTPHRSKDTEHFEALATDIVRNRRGSVEFGGVRFDVEVRTRSFCRRVGLYAFQEGTLVHKADITGYEDWVEVVADYLMFIAADPAGIVAASGK
jgi:hypothetical protein